MSINFCLLLIEFLLRIIPLNGQTNLNSHTVLEHYSYYDETQKFNNTFIDFINFKVYLFDKNNIIHKQNNNDFILQWNITEENKLLIQCLDITCSDIELSEQNVISFDFDKLLSTNGGIFAYSLILYGFFSFKRGYIFINLSIIFYGSFGFVLFIREIIQLLELTGGLSSEHKNSGIIVYLVYYSTLIISILYGFVCLFLQNLRYITFGFIEGNILSKIIFYLFIYFRIINKYLLLSYFLIELFLLAIVISLFVYLKNKYPKVNIVNIAIIGAIGIIIGINIINGGMPFIPYLILTSKYEENDIYAHILEKNNIGFYAFLFVTFIFCGFYWNNSSYMKLKNKSTSSIK